MELIIYQLFLRDNTQGTGVSSHFGVNESTGFTKPLSISLEGLC